MKTKIISFALALSSAFAFSQSNFWSPSSRANGELRERRNVPEKSTLYKLDVPSMTASLNTAPQRNSGNESLMLKFPDADGVLRNYILQENSIMAPALQAQFPEIRTYIGWEKGKPQNSVYITNSPYFGVSAMYFDGWDISYLDSYTKDNSTYIVYKRSDITNSHLFSCGTEESNKEILDSNVIKAPMVQDGIKRTYRLALAATGEYTTFHGGTAAQAMAAMTTTMNRVNGIYEKTFSVTMQMVANNNLLIYTDAATDPYTNGSPGTMISQNQTNTTTVIGAANYDVGHVFGTNSGGLAGLGVVCNTNSKARGVTGSGAPVGDPFDIDYVAHELGHQFGANHTFNGSTGSCNGNRSSSSAYEPGSGNTIMAYAGICGAENVQSVSTPHFHARSIQAIYAFITGNGNGCAAATATGNSEPTANAGADYHIPKGTAFLLTGSGTDPDGDAITYLWEQYDLGAATSAASPLSATTTTGPMYRSRIPTVSPTRYFPPLSSVVANNLTPAWEITPSVARTLNFSLIVADNKVTGGQSAQDFMQVTVTDNGPFTVTSQTTNTPLTANTAVDVTWNVAGTNSGTINTQNVDILLSTNGGLTFTTTLKSGTPNDGNESVLLPNENVSQARIMVRAAGNIYYALNPSSFSITGAMSTAEVKASQFAIYPNPASNEVTVKTHDSNAKGTYMIHDTAGRVVLNGKIAGETKINLERFSTGTYVISAELSDGEKHSEKLIVTK